jgi:hypothetical protein
MSYATGSTGPSSISAAPGGYGPPGGGYGGGGGGGGYGGGGYGPPGAPPPGGFGGGPPGGFGGAPPGYGGGPPGFGGPSGFNGPPGGYGGGPTDRAEAESKVKAPAITVMVFTVIGILLQLVSLAMNILGTGVNLANNPEAGQLMSGAMGIVMNLIGLLGGAFTIFGCLKMMKLQSRGLSYAAVIFSMIPCLGSCWCVNLGVGIWALIVLSDANVKASFES